LAREPFLRLRAIKIFNHFYHIVYVHARQDIFGKNSAVIIFCPAIQSSAYNLSLLIYLNKL